MHNTFLRSVLFFWVISNGILGLTLKMLSGKRNGEILSSTMVAENEYVSTKKYGRYIGDYKDSPKHQFLFFALFFFLFSRVENL